MKRQKSVIRLLINGSAFVQKTLDHFDLAILGGDMERSAAALVHGIDIGAVVQEDAGR